MPLTSIIIPTRNRATMLQRAIASARAAGRDVEVIVVDDASADETETICRSMSQIKYNRMAKNLGLARARNAGIAHSSGDFLVFLDDDDQLLPGSVDKQAEILSRNERVGFVYGQVLLADPHTCVPTGEVRPQDCPIGDVFWLLLSFNFLYVPSVMVRRRSLDTVGMFDPGLPGTEDWDLWIRLAENHAIESVNEPVAIYRDFSSDSGQMSSNRPRMSRSIARTVAKRLASRRALEAEVTRREELRKNWMDIVWNDLVSEGRLSLSTRRYWYAALNFATALQLNPRRAARFQAVGHFIVDAIGATRKNES